jgi:hypothetical protein
VIGNPFVPNENAVRRRLPKLLHNVPGQMPRFRLFGIVAMTIVGAILMIQGLETLSGGGDRGSNPTSVPWSVHLWGWAVCGAGVALIVIATAIHRRK